jgi:hypothetical protein
MSAQIDSDEDEDKGKSIQERIREHRERIR